jgi:hypothetical protein
LERAWFDAPLFIGRFDMASAPSTNIIPVTPLRSLYGWLRFSLRYLGNDVLHEALADAYLKKPKALEDLFVESHKDFAAYNNQDELFSPLKRSGRFDKSNRKGTVAVVKAIQKAAKEGSFSFGNLERQFLFVDREVGTLRSTSQSGYWAFSDGRSATNPGGGGIDLLLAEQLKDDTQVPIIGEIKFRNDQTPFFALIQALTYAVELATPNQQERLKKSYPTFFRHLVKEPVVG